jgi:anti-sigma regulatory factor (Ser/Thr protein kinase)
VLEEPASLEEPVGLGHEASDEGPSDEVHGLPARHREIALPADPTAPRRARALLQDVAQEWGLDDDLHQDVAMVVTELVANAVDHARTASTVTLGLDDGDLLVTVRDGCPDGAPRPRPVDPTAPRGRGLQMVDALAESWGVTAHADGKTVWAVLRTS